MRAVKACTFGVLLSFCLLINQRTFAITWVVPLDVPTIQAGIDSAAVGDTVIVECGEYFEYDIIMKSGISLLSSSGEPECVVLDANHNGRLLIFENVDNTTYVKGFTFQDGYDDAFGGAIVLSNASPTISHCNFESNTSGFGGGGISLSNGSNPYFSYCLFNDNSALRGGAFHCVDSTPTIANCSIVFCSAFEYGAGFWVNNSDPIIHNTIIAFSITGEAFSCFYQSPGNPTLYCCDIFGNLGGDWSGSCIEYLQYLNDNFSEDPLFCDMNDSDFTLRNASPCSEDNNPACGLVGSYEIGCEGLNITVSPDGSGDVPTIQDAVDLSMAGDSIILLDGTYSGPGNRDIYVTDKSITISSVNNDPTMCIVDCDGHELEHHIGFNIDNDDINNTFDISGISITNSYTDNQGGALHIINTTTIINNCMIYNNHAPRSIAFYVNLPTNNIWLTISNTQILNNEGGAIYLQKAWPGIFSDFINCHISNNHGNSVEFGGGDISGCGGNFSYCVITGNIGHGLKYLGDESTVSNCTITNNAGKGVSGIGVLNIDNTHIAHNGGTGISMSPVMMHWGSDLTVTNSIITYNDGGASIPIDSSGEFFNTTIRYNYYDGGCDIYVDGSFPYPGGAAAVCCDVDTNYVCGDGYFLLDNNDCEYIPGTFSEYEPNILGYPGRSTGVSFVDYDSDSNLDIYVCNSYNQPNRIYTNEGGGVFSGSSYPPLGATGWSEGHTWGDYNNDGRLDLYLANWDTPNLLLFNEGNRAFSDITEPPLDYIGNTRSVSWVDFDLDGDLDLYLANEDGPNMLFMHEPGIGFFAIGSAPINEPLPCTAAAWCDYDNDGDQDVYLSLVNVPNVLIRNDGNGIFVDATSPPLDDTGTGQGVAWGDYDNDGDFDLYLCNYGQENKLFRNDGSDTFSDQTIDLLGDTGDGQSGTWGDYDNDGDIDLYVTNYGQTNNLFVNEGNGVFSNNMSGVILDDGFSTGTAWGDYDEDGDLDIYLATWYEPNICMRNDQEYKNHWLHLNLVGTLSNHSCIGARIKLVAGGTTQIREIGSNNGFRSENSKTVEFGLRNWSEPDSLIIIWPRKLENGQLHTTILTGADIIIDSIMEIVEPGDATVSVDGDSDIPQVFAIHQNYPNPFNPITTISFDLPSPLSTTISIYDIQGRHVMDLLRNQLLVPGTYYIQWDSTDKSGLSVSSGQYFYRIDAGDFGLTKKMMLIK